MSSETFYELVAKSRAPIQRDDTKSTTVTKPALISMDRAKNQIGGFKLSEAISVNEDLKELAQKSAPSAMKLHHFIWELDSDSYRSTIIHETQIYPWLIHGCGFSGAAVLVTCALEKRKITVQYDIPGTLQGPNRSSGPDIVGLCLKSQYTCSLIEVKRDKVLKEELSTFIDSLSSSSPPSWDILSTKMCHVVAEVM
jgi:hypothetical protein